MHSLFCMWTPNTPYLFFSSYAWEFRLQLQCAGFVDIDEFCNCHRYKQTVHRWLLQRCYWYGVICYHFWLISYCDSILVLCNIIWITAFELHLHHFFLLLLKSLNCFAFVYFLLEIGAHFLQEIFRSKLKKKTWQSSVIIRYFVYFISFIFLSLAFFHLIQIDSFIRLI